MVRDSEERGVVVGEGKKESRLAMNEGRRG